MSTKQPKKYKIQVGTPKVSDETINRHKNFPGLLDQHRHITKDLYRKPLYKNPKAFLFLFLMAVIFYLVYLAFQEDKEMEMKEKGDQEQMDDTQPGDMNENMNVYPFN